MSHISLGSTHVHRANPEGCNQAIELVKNSRGVMTCQGIRPKQQLPKLRRQSAGWCGFEACLLLGCKPMLAEAAEECHHKILCANHAAHHSSLCASHCRSEVSCAAGGARLPARPTPCPAGFLQKPQAVLESCVSTACCNFDSSRASQLALLSVLTACLAAEVMRKYVQSEFRSRK